MSFEHIHALAQGTRLNQYEMMQILGAGGFGITYLAKDTSLDTTVAIKEYLPGDLATRLGDSTVTAKSSNSKGDFDWGMSRFLEEARVLAKFRHPNIIHINQIFEKNNTAYIVMDYAKGESLESMLHRVGTLTEQQIKDILFPILDGLKRVHAMGFLHRDIKPGNIIVRDEDGAVLIDFGAAREATGSKSKAITSIVTEGYAPLEQYDATGNQGPWTDIYALGAVAYKCLTGNKPPSATSRVRTDHLVPLSVAAPGRVSEDFASAIEMSLRVIESERPQTIDEFLAVVSGATMVHATPPADATVVMRADATVVMPSGPASVRPDATVAVKSDLSTATKSFAPPPVKVAPPSAHVAVLPASMTIEPTQVPAVARSRTPLYLGVAAAVLLIGGAGGWYYTQLATAPVAGNTQVASSTVQPAPTTASVTPSTSAPAVTAPAPAPAETATTPPPVSAPPPAPATPTPIPNTAEAVPPQNVPPAAQSPATTPAPAQQTAKGPTPPPTPPAPPPPPKLVVPAGPPTPAKALAMLRDFTDPVLKATLAQPGLRARVETLIGLEGCNWRVNPQASRQPETRAAANYLNRMDDDNLRDVLTDAVMTDRIDAQFGRGRCNVTRQTESTITNGFPDPSTTNRDPGPYPGYPGEYGTRQNNGRRPPVVPGAPYGYGGVVPGYVP